MSTPWERAHERLLEQLKDRVRTHSRRQEMLAQAGDRRGRQFIPPQHKAGRAVLVRGRKFPSVSAAARKLHVHARDIYKWMRMGRAKYL